ncbi:LysR family transcriptional regulator [Marinobacterium nitratireducens]|nr:LysR family transcriptional regulator [Marinobacterium nitratireducens]
MNLRKVDLNLLVILEVLLEERHVTRAAERLDMSQPAVSRALQRLRETFADPLLVKSIHGYDLSARAEELLPALKSVLQDLGQLVGRPVFDPASSTAQVRVACLDLEGALFLPRLLEAMRRDALQMQLDIHSQPGDHFMLLQQGDVDFVISGLVPPQGEAQINRIPLATTCVVCVMRHDHPLATAPLTLDAYISASHGYVSMTGRGVSVMDQLLRGYGLQRQVVVRTNSFLTVPEFCARTDLLFALPQIVAERLTRDGQLIMKALPSELAERELRFYLYWHQRHHRDPMHRWVRRQLVADPEEAFDLTDNNQSKRDKESD